MNILVICRLRTRSTYFLKAMCDFYGLHNFNEDYFTLPTSYSCSLQYANEHPIFYNSQFKKWEKYHDMLEDKTSEYFQQDNFGIKLFSKTLSSHPLFLKSSNFSKIMMLKNFDNIFQLLRYQKIYFLERNFIDSLASFLYSIEVGKSIYYSKSEIKNKKIYFSQNLFNNANSYILDYIIQQKMKNILDQKNINYTLLNYEEIPNYLTKFENKDFIKKSIDTKLDYKSLIINYDQLEDYVNDNYQIIVSHTNDL